MYLKAEELPFEIEKQETQGLYNSIKYHKRYSFEFGIWQAIISYDAHTRKYYPFGRNLTTNEQVPFYKKDPYTMQGINGFDTLIEAKRKLFEFYKEKNA
jgi:hypothetical protein